LFLQVGQVLLGLEHTKFGFLKTEQRLLVSDFCLGDSKVQLWVDNSKKQLASFHGISHFHREATHSSTDLWLYRNRLTKLNAPGSRNRGGEGHFLHHCRGVADLGSCVALQSSIRKKARYRGYYHQPHYHGHPQTPASSPLVSRHSDSCTFPGLSLRFRGHLSVD